MGIDIMPILKNFAIVAVYNFSLPYIAYCQNEIVNTIISFFRRYIIFNISSTKATEG